LLLLLISTLASWLVLELLLRQLVPGITLSPREDPLLGWSSREYQLFDPNDSTTPQSKRILFLGDSYLAGCGVSTLDSRFPVLMDKLLGDACTVTILASGGWGTDQQLLAYMAKGALWRPDIVVVAFCANNDISNIISHQHGPRLLKPYFTFSEPAGLKLNTYDGTQLDDISGNVQLCRVQPTPFWKRSLLLRFVALRVHALATSEQYEPAAFPFVDERYKQFQFGGSRQREIYDKKDHLTWAPQMGVNAVSAYIHENFSYNTYQWLLFEQLLVKLHHEVKRNHGQLVLMMLPVIFNPGDLDTIAGGPFTQAFRTPEGAFTFRSAEPQERLAEICLQQNITFFDPSHEFKTHIVENSLHSQVWPSDRHFSEPGHDILAEISEKWFARLLSQSTNSLNEGNSVEARKLRRLF